MFCSTLLPFPAQLFPLLVKNDIHAMKFILFPFRWMWYGCSGRQGIRVAFERWVYFTIYLILRYIIPRIWAWKFHSIVENLIWYFFFSVVLRFSAKMRKKIVSRVFRHSRGKQRWDLVGNCISIPFGSSPFSHLLSALAGDLFACTMEWWALFTGNLFASSSSRVSDPRNLLAFVIFLLFP